MDSGRGHVTKKAVPDVSGVDEVTQQQAPSHEGAPFIDRHALKAVEVERRIGLQQDPRNSKCPECLTHQQTILGRGWTLEIDKREAKLLIAPSRHRRQGQHVARLKSCCDHDAKGIEGDGVTADPDEIARPQLVVTEPLLDAGACCWLVAIPSGDVRPA